MTHPPKCPVCQNQHWLSEPHIWGDEKPRDEKPKPSRAKFDRTAYQREYMRKRRASKKDQKQ